MERFGESQGKDNKGKNSERKFWSRDRYFQILAIVLVLSFSALLFYKREWIVGLGSYGYAGAFIISALSSASIVVPLPGWIFIATLGAILDPLWVGIASGLGGTLGEMTGYVLGYGSRLAVERNNLYLKMVGWMRRWGGLTIFVLSLIPNPIFDIAGATAGLLRYPLWKFTIFGAAGRIPKHILFAYSGSWGMNYLPFL